MTGVPSSQIQNDLAVFEKISRSKAAWQGPKAKVGRRSALIIGSLCGLAYGLTNQLINTYLLPGIPLPHYPFGLVGNVIAAFLGGLMVGWLIAAPKSVWKGIMFSGCAILALIALRVVLVQSVPFSLWMMYAFDLYALIVALVSVVFGLPGLLLFRLAAQVQSERWAQPWWSWVRIRLPLLLVFTAAFLGTFSGYGEDARSVLTYMNRLILRGKGASSQADLPKALKNGQDAQAFLQHANMGYNLELSGDPGLLKHLATEYREYEGYDYKDVVVLARFTDGWTLACLYRNIGGGWFGPACRGYTPDNSPPVYDMRASKADHKPYKMITDARIEDWA